MTDVAPDSREQSAKKFFFKPGGGGTLSAYERSSPIYSLLSGQRVGQIPIDEHKEIDREEIAGCQRIVSGLGWVFLLAAVLCSQLPWVTVPRPAALTAAVTAFAVFLCTVRRFLRKDHGARWLLALNTWAAILFITAAVWQTGTLASPLLPLHFIVIMLTGTILDMRTVVAQTAFVSVCYVLMAIDGTVFAGGAAASLRHLSGPLMRAALLWAAACTVSLVAKEINISKEKIRQLSRTDQLTGLWNMKMLLIFMQREYQRILIRAGKFSVLMIDADSLKAVNDAYGHQAGTMLIVSISETMRAELREEDMLARFGGDEFVAFLPETGCQEAWKVAERLRIRIAETPLHFDGDPLCVTVSCGIACFPEHGEDLTRIMEMADRALYRSKNRGKNCCTIFSPDEDRERGRFA
jgi:diguanylate cyclase (GGDEF)-like protein